MFRRLSTITMALCLSAAVATTAQAQATCSVTGTGSCSPVGTFVTGTMAQISFLSINVASFGLTMPVAADFSGGGSAAKIDLAGQTATVRANGAWALTIQSAAAFTGTGNNLKAVGDVTWKTGAGSYAGLSTTPASVGSGVATGGTAFAIDYTTTWFLATDTPGTYSLAVTFTLTAS